MKAIRLFFIKKRSSKGIALLITLLSLTILTLLVLSLLLQSQIDYLIANDEQDAASALFYAEAALAWSKRKVIDASDLTALLRGPDATDDAGADDDHLPGLRTLNLGITPADFRGGAGNCPGANCEQEVSTAVTVNGIKYEVTRLGTDSNGDSFWDGPRALVYVRLDDNYDEAPATNNPRADSDDRLSVSVIAEYPIHVDANGQQVASLRPFAQRRLHAQFGPSSTLPAIIGNRDLSVPGNLLTCGECGSVHANGDMIVGGNPEVCQNLTSSDQYTETGSPDVRGDKGGSREEINVAVINPYDDLYVPRESHFTGLEFGCSSPKYFALVPLLNGSNQGQVYKAYWDVTSRQDNPSGGWKWRLIDVLGDGVPTVLDDCGRLVSGSIGGVALSPDAGAGPGVTPLVPETRFYGLELQNIYQAPATCTGDATLCSTCDIEENDFNIPDFYDYTTNSVLTDSNLPMLPGSFHKDTVRDFSENKLQDQNPLWRFPENIVFSPLYNSVIFVYGSIRILGNPDSLCDSNGPCDGTEAVPNNLWKISIIAVGNIYLSTNKNISPANMAGDYAFTAVAGRDLVLNGNFSIGQSKCGSVGNECQVQPGNSSLFAGIFGAHEQVGFSGNPSVDGIIVIEDAVDCSAIVQRQSGYTRLNGNGHVHYDCENPANPWADSVEMNAWQEVQ